MTTTLTKDDLHVRDAVIHQLDWDSEVDASGIGVTAREGVVTLTGFIDSYAGKLAAERATKRVRGVKAVANDIQVRLMLDRTDSDIAADVVHALSLRATLPPTVQAVVHAGHVTLTGSVPTLFDRAVAGKALRYIRGMKDVVNRIEVVPSASARDVRERIVKAIHDTAELDAQNVTVGVFGHRVVLTGTVGSWRERDAAERAASHAPGISDVDNQIAVVWPGDGAPQGDEPA